MKNVNKILQSQMGADKLLKKCLALVQESRTAMSGYYARWDEAYLKYKGELEPSTEEERKRKKDGKVSRISVPTVFAQVQTATSFWFLLFQQNKDFFQLQPSGPEDYDDKEVAAQAVLENDLKLNNWNNILYTMLLDAARYNLCAVSVLWSRQTATFSDISVDPLTGDETFAPQTVTINEFNKLRIIKPYRVFPDTRLPLSEYQDGEFCAHEEDYVKSTLLRMESEGEVYGIEFIPAMSSQILDARGPKTLRSSAFSGKDPCENNRRKGNEQSIVVTRMEVWLNPSKTEITDGVKLGDENFAVLYIVWIANDKRIIRCEPANSWHQKFSLCLGLFNPDNSELIADGMTESIGEMQDMIAWLLNAHLKNSGDILKNRLVVDPNFVDVKTLNSDGHILMKKNSGLALERSIKQLEVRDVTGQHVSDAQNINGLVQQTTGVNDNVMGQYNSGRRSSLEARVVTGSAAGRLKTHASLLFENCFAWLGRIMLGNARQGLSKEVFARIVGEERAERLYPVFSVTRVEAMLSQDFFLFDSSLPSEKLFTANSLNELLMLLLQNPESAVLFDLSPKAILEAKMELQGAGAISRFSLKQRIQNGKDTINSPPAITPPTGGFGDVPQDNNV